VNSSLAEMIFKNHARSSIGSDRVW